MGVGGDLETRLEFALNCLHWFAIALDLSLLQCDRTQSFDAFYQEIQSEGPPNIALLGCGCSAASEPIAEVIHHWNISQVL